MKLRKAAEKVRDGASDITSRAGTIIRTNNPLERVMREIRRRFRGCFPDGNSVVR